LWDINHDFETAQANGLQGTVIRCSPRDKITHMKHQVTPEYLTLAELAIYASVCKNTCKGWLKTGMPYYKVNRCIRVRVGEFNDWMNRFRSGTSEDLDAMLDQVMKEVKQ
jgi:hypothetical protein